MKNYKMFLESKEYDDKLNNYPNISVDEVFDFIYYLIYNAPIFMDNKFIDLYPGYRKNMDGDIYYYNTKEEGVDNVKSVMKMFNSFPNVIKVYRTIGVRDGEKINYEKLGQHWTFDKETAIDFSKFFSGNIVLTGEINHKYVNWLSSFKLYFEFSNGAYKRSSGSDFNENELYIPDPTNVKNVDYFNI